MAKPEEGAETPETPQPPETPAPVVDLSELMGAIESIGESIKGIDERVTGVEEIFKQATTDPNADPRLQPPANWGALREEMEQMADRKAEEKLAARERAETEARQERDKLVADLDAEFDRMADEAVKKGYLPNVEKKEDRNDPGNVARRELFGYGAYLGTTNLLQAAQSLAEMHKAGVYYNPEAQGFENRTSPGRFAPVGSSANRTAVPSRGISYKELHSLSMDALKRKFDATA